jgi:hypothetical protein
VTPFEQIDFVFLYIKEHTQYGGSIGYHNIENYVNATPEAGITITMLKEILKRLEDDSYITVRTPEESQTLYHTSFNGLLFDGYKKAKKKRDREAIFQRRLNISNFWTPILTGVIAFIALIQSFQGDDKQSPVINAIYTQDQALQQDQLPKTQSPHDTGTKILLDTSRTSR